MEKQNKIFQNKNKYIEDSQDSILNQVRKGEEFLFRTIISELVGSLPSENGQFKPNSLNTSMIISKLNRIFREHKKKYTNDAVKAVVKTFDGVNKFNSAYFGVVADDFDFDSIENRTNKTMLGSVGLKDKKIVSGGLLDLIGDNTAAKREIQEIIIRNVQGSGNVRAFIEGLEETVIGTKERAGILDRRYRNDVVNKIDQYDRAQSNSYARSLNMQAAIYSGGKVTDTRDFCKKRDGKVFIIEEIEKWSKLKFQGKTKNYNPFVDAGGYNCRHSLQWITNRQAIRLRPDLRIVQNKGKKPLLVAA